MSEFIAALQTEPLLADGAIGSLLFERTGRLSSASFFYESLTIEQPEIIRDVHLAYLEAGARCLTTNTFAATRSHLGDREKVALVNRDAVILAREAIDAFRPRAAETSPIFVLASVGPAPRGDDSRQLVEEEYSEQLIALLAAEPDAIAIESFRSLEHVIAVLDLLKGMANSPPVIVQMALEREAGGWNTNPVTFVETALSLGAAVVGANCCSPWDAADFVAELEKSQVTGGDLLLSAMPNAGGFQRIGNRFMTHVNPEFMGAHARTLAERGVRLIGGCCEVHPDHIREMYGFLASQRRRTTAIVLPPSHRPVELADKRANGRFSRKLVDGEFAVSVELLPSRGTAPKTFAGKIDFVRALAESGLADAVDVTDGSRGIPLMPPGDFIQATRRDLDWQPGNEPLELIPHFTARDLNVMGVQSRLIGYWANGIHNVIFITGDPPKMSPSYPRSTAVFDFDSVGLIHYTHGSLNAGVDFGGQPLGRHADPRTHFTIGTGFEPEAVDGDEEIERLRRKLDAGADYIMTQPVFRLEALDALHPFRSQTRILVGVLILRGLEHARRIDDIPGVTVPREILERLASPSSEEDQRREGELIAAEQIQWARQQGWSGLYLMSPATHRPVVEVLAQGLKLK